MITSPHNVYTEPVDQEHLKVDNIRRPRPKSIVEARQSYAISRGFDCLVLCRSLTSLNHSGHNIDDNLEQVRVDVDASLERKKQRLLIWTPYVSNLQPAVLC